MKLHVWGTDFRRSDSGFRQRLHLPEERRQEGIQALLRLGFRDLIYVATCNRVEFYTSAENYYEDTRPRWLELLRWFGLPEEDYYRGYHFEGKSALRHLLRVASSLESLVLGEPQILGQLKDAYHWTRERGFPLDRSLEKAFHLAFETAKAVRTETEVGSGSTSVAGLALRHMENQEARFPLRHVVAVGRSPMCRTVVQWMKRHRPGVPLLWVNRTLSALEELPESEGVVLGSLESFLRRPLEFSHLFTATSSATPLFTPKFFEPLSWDPKLVFDLAEPPDVWLPADCDDHKAQVVRLENLQEEARRNRESRRLAVQDAEGRIEEAIREYFLRQKQAPVLREFNAVELKFLEELERAVEALSEDFSHELQEKIRKWGERLVKRNLHNSREHLRLILGGEQEAVSLSSPSGHKPTSA